MRAPYCCMPLILLAAALAWAAERAEGPKRASAELVHATPAADPFDTPLQAIGLTKATFTFDYDDMSNYGGDRYVVPLFYTLHSSPFKIEHYSKVFTSDLLAGAASVNALVSFGSRRVNETVRRGLIARPIDAVRPKLEGSDPLYCSIRHVEAFYGGALTRRADEQLKREAAAVPLEIQKLAAAILYTAADSLRYREHAFARAAKVFDMDSMYARVQEVFASDEDIVGPAMESLIDAVDFRYLYTFSQDLAMAVDFVADSLARLDEPGVFEFDWQTRLGRVVVNDGHDHFYPADEYLLVIDTGGNDRYATGAATKGIRNPISVVIDAAGNDTCIADPGNSPCFGAGIFGCAYHVDLAGDDTYRGRNHTQGLGLFGVGVLQDRQGNDTYDGYVLAQGAGAFGTGALADLSGDDTYLCYQQSQGYGFTKGCGVLVDVAGRDRYAANDSLIDFPSPQTAEHNANLAQGVGFGKRADYVDGHSWAGGFGILADGAGDDHYRAGLFAQGCAYWYAVGILSDVEGDDVYDAIWYVQGSGAHFGLGVLLDSRGDDVYSASMNMAQGAGHDFTLGCLIDEQGNDTYNAPYLSLGGGNANGIGLFWDKRGDDAYNSTATLTLGRSNTLSRGTLRDHINTVGFFIDTGGRDRYPLAYPDSVEVFRNDALWTRPGMDMEHPIATEKGVGYDCEWEAP